MDHLRVARPATFEARAIELGSRGLEARQSVTFAGAVADSCCHEMCYFDARASDSWHSDEGTLNYRHVAYRLAPPSL